MPYIKQDRRKKINPVLEGPHKRIESEHIETAGDLNYAMTVLAIDYIRRNGLCYQSIAEVLSAFDGGSKEFYRRVAAEYENDKIKANGDVY
jgi:hypothetical protein